MLVKIRLKLYKLYSCIEIRKMLHVFGEDYIHKKIKKQTKKKPQKIGKYFKHQIKKNRYHYFFKGKEKSLGQKKKRNSKLDKRTR